MPQVRITEEALDQIATLPLRLQVRLESIIDRLEKWPEVSGAKPLRGDLKGCYRIRTGDYRVVFAAADDIVTIMKVSHRKNVYED
ncbi:MAG: type II toxin-antitoxin system RelE/ParE family toxin [Phycisphaeraceae bacterium]